ncbi:hypothetical protein [Succinimonas sp.]|uniref:hypothetical protein n=1 Tax=Succinimonas sp. TaxID=1936151 RepID=UPI00387067EC
MKPHSNPDVRDDLALSDLIVDEVNGSFGEGYSEIVVGMILHVLTVLLCAVNVLYPEPVGFALDTGIPTIPVSYAAKHLKTRTSNICHGDSGLPDVYVLNCQNPERQNK